MSEKRYGNRIVPSPWVAKVRGDWSRAREFEVEFRVGVRGAWRPVQGDGHLDVVEVITQTEAGEEKTVGVEQASEYAQTLFDACHAHRDEAYAEKRCDYRLLAWGPDKDGKGRVPIGEPEGQGGRLGPEDKSDDVPADEDSDKDDDAKLGMIRGILREMRLERKEFVGLILQLARGHVDLSEQSRGVVRDAIDDIKAAAQEKNNLEVELKKVDLAAYRTQEAAATLNNMGEKFAPAATTWAQARYQESVNDRKRKPSGDEVKDKFLLLTDSMDLLTFATVKEHLPDDVSELLEAMFMKATMATGAELVQFWADLRKPLEPHWGALMGALPDPVRRALSEFAYAVEAAEKKAKDGAG